MWVVLATKDWKLDNLTDLLKHGIINDSFTIYLLYIQIVTPKKTYLRIRTTNLMDISWTSQCQDGHTKAGEICYLAGAFPFSVGCWDFGLIGLMNFSFHELQPLLGKTWNATTVVTNVKKSEIDGKQLVKRPFQKSLRIFVVCPMCHVSVFVFFFLSWIDKLLKNTRSKL